MKIYTVTQKYINKGAYVTLSPYPHIGIGEEGRGRRYTRFPIVEDVLTSLPCKYRGQKKFEKKCPLCGAEGELAQTNPNMYKHPDYGMFNGLEADNHIFIYTLSVIKTRKKGTLLGVPERKKDERVLVKLDIQGGFRGNCFLTGPNGEALEDVVTVLARGHGAEGAAGYAGGPHEKTLVIMKPGDTVLATRGGRLYGNPSQIYVHYDGQEIKMGEKDEVFPPVMEDAEDGIEI